MTHPSARINFSSAHLSSPTRRTANVPVAGAYGKPVNITQSAEIHALEHFRRQLLAAVGSCYAAGLDRDIIDAEIEGSLNALRSMRELHA